MGTYCRSTLQVQPVTLDERGETELAAFWSTFLTTDSKTGKEIITFQNLFPDPSGELDEEWRIENWGVSWISWSQYDYEIERYVFSTKNGPPIPFFEEVSKRFPSLVFLLEYSNIEHDYCGIALIVDGHVRSGMDGQHLFQDWEDPVPSGVTWNVVLSRVDTDC